MVFLFEWSGQFCHCGHTDWDTNLRVGQFNIMDNISYEITRIKILFWMFLLLELFVLNSARDGN